MSATLATPDEKNAIPAQTAVSPAMNSAKFSALRFCCRHTLPSLRDSEDVEVKYKQNISRSCCEHHKEMGINPRITPSATVKRNPHIFARIITDGTR